MAPVTVADSEVDREASVVVVLTDDAVVVRKVDLVV